MWIIQDDDALNVVEFQNVQILSRGVKFAESNRRQLVVVTLHYNLFENRFAVHQCVYQKIVSQKRSRLATVFDDQLPHDILIVAVLHYLRWQRLLHDVKVSHTDKHVVGRFTYRKWLF